MRVAVVGVGGVGGYFGAKLAQAGEELICIAHGATLQALRTSGLRLESSDGDLQIQPAAATDDPATIGAVDLVLLTVKAWPRAHTRAHYIPGRHTRRLLISSAVGARLRAFSSNFARRVYYMTARATAI